ncbi:MAG: hypothetical protein Q8P20_05200 [bacterium]|nr:hypothetical protein [bacterium]MDZ4228368.1 hypothetical protein [Candidatus Levybacteria bacterium]
MNAFSEKGSQEKEGPQDPRESFRWLRARPGMRITISGEECNLGRVKGEENNHMQYNMHGDKLSFFDENGDEWVSCYTKEREKALRDYGYKRGTFFVPFVNDEMPLDRSLWTAFSISKDEQREERYQEQQKLFDDKGEKRNLKEVGGGEWLLIDGLEYRLLQDDRKIERMPYHINDVAVPDRLDNVGKYDVNNGVVAYIDGKGQCYIGPSTKERIEALRLAGYITGSFFVPFSNAEIIEDNSIRQQWQKIWQSF